MTAASVQSCLCKDVNHFFGAGPLRRQILFDVTADIFPGEIIMVMGPSGSGKTTLLTLIGALRTAAGGSLRVLNTELRSAARTALTAIRQRIGFIFQEHHLLESLSARQNVQMSLGGAGLIHSGDPAPVRRDAGRSGARGPYRRQPDEPLRRATPTCRRCPRAGTPP